MLAPQQAIVWINANLRCEGAAADLLYFRLPTYVCQRMREQTRTHLGAEANASGSRDERVWEQTRLHTGWRSPKGIGAEAKAMFFRLSALFPVSGHQRQLNPAKRNVLDLKNETCKNREKRNVLKISHTRHFKTTKKQSKTGCFYSF